MELRAIGQSKVWHRTQTMCMHQWYSARLAVVTHVNNPKKKLSPPDSFIEPCPPLPALHHHHYVLCIVICTVCIVIILNRGVWGAVGAVCVSWGWAGWRKERLGDMNCVIDRRGF